MIQKHSATKAICGHNTWEYTADTSMADDNVYTDLYSPYKKNRRNILQLSSFHMNFITTQ
jgi:hypothetical protein